MPFSAFAPSVSSAVTSASVSQTTKPIRRPSAVVGCKTTIARGRRSDTGSVKFGCPRRSSMNVLVYAAGGEVSYWANQAKETHPLQYYSFEAQGLGHLVDSSRSPCSTTMN